MRDITLEDTFRHQFTTRAFATGIPTVLAGTPVLSVLEENNATPITSGVSVSVDRASVVGLNEATIVATAANGYEAGKSYAIYISTGTVGGVSIIGEVVGQFTIELGAAFIRLGAPAGASVSADIAVIEGQTDDIGVAGAGLTAINLPDQTMNITGNITGDLSGSVGSVTADVGITAAAVDDIWDEILTGATHNIADSAGRRVRDLQEFGVYEDGAVWIDTINGSPGTTDFESGTPFNPVDTLADATTLATSLGLSRFRIAPGSNITLASTFNNFLFTGDDSWTLALGGQDISDSTFIGATVSGIAVGTGTQKFRACSMGAVTLPADTHVIEGSSVTGTQTLPAGDMFYDSWHSGLAGPAAPVFDFGAAVLNTNLNLRHSSGGIEFQNMGQAGTDIASIEGDGQVIFNANCIGGTVFRRGNWDLTDNSGGAVVETLDDNTINIADILVDTADMQPKLGTPTVDISADIAAVKAETALIVADTNELQTDDIPGLIAALNDISVTDILTTQMTEAFAADGVAPTLTQALFLIQQMLGDFAISGTTLTVRQIDGITTAATFTLSDATNPTALTRTT